jgi:hypothetical protein
MMKIQTVLGTIVVLGTIAGGLITVDSHYAKSFEVAEVSAYVNRIEERLDEKIQADRANSLQERMWRLEDRHSQDKAKTMDEYRRLEQEREEIIRKQKR